MKHSKVIFGLLSLILLLSLNYCREPQDNITTPPPAFGDQIVPGEIVAGLDDTVSYSFANDFFSQFPIEIIQLNIDSLFAIWLEIEEGDPQAFISILSQYPFIMWAEQRGYPGEDRDSTKNYLLAQFNSLISIDSAKAVIGQINGISVKRIFVPHRWAYLRVEVGKELFWCDVLMTYPFVRYAEPNAIGIRGSNKV
jgi:hypothetical protein